MSPVFHAGDVTPGVTLVRHCVMHVDFLEVCHWNLTFGSTCYSSDEALIIAGPWRKNIAH